MNKSQIGLIAEIDCRFKKTDASLIASISEKRGIPEDRIKSKMKYNMFTINQFADITGLSVSNILNKTRSSVINGVINTELNFCYPFSDENNEGPKFIVRDAKAEEYINRE